MGAISPGDGGVTKGAESLWAGLVYAFLKRGPRPMCVRRFPERARWRAPVQVQGSNLVDDEQLRPGEVFDLPRETIFCDGSGHAPSEVDRGCEVDAMPMCAVRLISAKYGAESVLESLPLPADVLSDPSELDAATNERKIAENGGNSAIGPGELLLGVPEAHIVNAPSRIRVRLAGGLVVSSEGRGIPTFPRPRRLDICLLLPPQFEPSPPQGVCNGCLRSTT